MKSDHTIIHRKDVGPLPKPTSWRCWSKTKLSADRTAYVIPRLISGAARANKIVAEIQIYSKVCRKITGTNGKSSGCQMRTESLRDYIHNDSFLMILSNTRPHICIISTPLGISPAGRARWITQQKELSFTWFLDADWKQSQFILISAHLQPLPWHFQLIRSTRQLDELA